jgi:predicted ATPase
LLKTLPDTPNRTLQELDLQITLGAPLMATKGYGAAEVEKTYARARELCQQVGETPQIFPALLGLCGFYLVRAELQTAQELGQQILRLARSLQDRMSLLLAHFSLGPPLFWLGEFQSARTHLEAGSALYDSLKDRFLAWQAGLDPGVVCLSYAALTLWFQGYPDQALKRSHEALTLARQLSHPHSVAEALCFIAWLHQFRREGQTAQEWAEAVIALSTEQDFSYWLASGTLLHGWALAEQGQIEKGIAQMSQSMAAGHPIGITLGQPWFLALLAGAYGKSGRAEEGLTALAGALDMVQKTGECFYEAELYRLKGTLTLQSKTSPGQVSDKSQTSQEPVEDKSRTSLGQGEGKSAVPNTLHPTPYTHVEAEREVEGYFLKAIDIARRQEAKLLELRAVTSLSRLLQRQGKTQEARKMLTEIYDWFTEGFETVDLTEARELLAEIEMS